MARLVFPPDYADLLREFATGGVEFVVVGGWAVAAHGHPRATDDLDILVRPSSANAKRVLTALKRYGAPLSDHEVTEELFRTPRYGYRMGRMPLLIEILTTIDGVTFDDAMQGNKRCPIDDFTVPVIGRAALLVNKRAAGRPKDLADIQALEHGGADTRE